MLPALSVAKALETTGRHSVGGLTSARTVLVTARPYRAPPQTIAHVGLIASDTFPCRVRCRWRPMACSSGMNGWRSDAIV